VSLQQKFKVDSKKFSLSYEIVKVKKQVAFFELRWRIVCPKYKEMKLAVLFLKSNQ